MSKDLMNPFNDDFDDSLDPMNNFFDKLGRSMLDTSFFNPRREDDFLSSMPNMMRTNVSDDGKAYHVTAELPGFKKSSIHMDYRNNTLRINAVHQLNKKATNKKGHVIRQERSNSNVARQFHLPDVDFDKISASYDGGLLHVVLPKLHANQNDSHRISIK